MTNTRKQKLVAKGPCRVLFLFISFSLFHNTILEPYAYVYSRTTNETRTDSINLDIHGIELKACLDQYLDINNFASLI